jgi:hypothetical protein
MFRFTIRPFGGVGQVVLAELFMNDYWVADQSGLAEPFLISKLGRHHNLLQDVQKGRPFHPPSPGTPRRAFPGRGRSER